MEALARRILTRPIEVQVGGRSVVSDSVTQFVVVLGEDQKFFKLLEVLGLYQDRGSMLVFVEKQVTADVLLKVCCSCWPFDSCCFRHFKS
jgi:ATP-dependent RNA helicase DDX46/PRP5